MRDKHGANFSARDGAPGVSAVSGFPPGSPGDLRAGGAQEGLQAGAEQHGGRPVLQRARVWAEVSDGAGQAVSDQHRAGYEVGGGHQPTDSVLILNI